MVNLFDSLEECSSIDAGQVEKENANHARESLAGLRQLAKKTYNPKPSSDAKAHAKRMLKDPYRRAPNKAQYWPKPSQYVHNQLEDAKLWLSVNRSELPPEIENENGRLNGNCRLEVTGFDEMVADAAIADSSREDDTVGLFYVGGHSCYASLESTASADDEDLKLLRDFGMVASVYSYLMTVRGEKFKQYHSHQAKMFRWRGMQEYRAIGRADELLAQGVTLKKANSGAIECPSQERLNELLSYDPVTGELTWAVARGRCAAGAVAYLTRKDGKLRTRVDGVDYYTSRLVWRLVTGEDAGASTIDFVNGDAADLRWANLSIQHSATSSEGDAVERERVILGGEYYAQCMTSKGKVKIGVFATEREATEARRIFVKAMTYAA